MDTERQQMIDRLIEQGGLKPEDNNNPWLAYERFKKAMRKIITNSVEYDAAIRAYTKKWKPSDEG